MTGEKRSVTLCRVELPMRWSTLHPSVLPVGLWVVMVAEQLAVRPAHLAVGLAGATVIALAFAVRRRRPLVAVVTVPVVMAVGAMLGVSTKQTSTPILAAFWAIFLLFAALEGRRRVVGVVVVLLGVALSMLFDGGAADLANLLDSAVFGLALCVPAAVTGAYVRARHRYTAVVEERALLLESRREMAAAAAVADERMRIARELHDVIAHSVGLMGVQAAAVRRLLEPEQDKLREVLLSVEETGRSAIDELAHVLRVLRGTAAEAGGAPQPSLDDVAGLVSAGRAAGQEIVLEVTGAPASVPPGVALSAYRIVQEALTNARKHAPAAPVRLGIDCRQDGLEVRVSNPLPAALPLPRSSGAGGHGLIGMQERVAAFGGSLTATPCAGNFVVAAVLPTRTPVAVP
jgi:signal transduction histidine kinase